MSYVDYRKELATIATDTSKAQNVDWLGTDFQLSRAGNLVRITLAIDAAVEVALVPSSGSNINLNGGSAMTANAVYTEELALDQARTWNLQTPNVAGCNVIHLVVVEVQA